MAVPPPSPDAVPSADADGQAAGSGAAKPGLIERIFTLDLRSLALYRIALAAIVIADLIRRAEDLRAHYTDIGVLPRADMLEYYKTAGKWTVHLFSGGWQGMALIFFIHGLFALAMLLGYRTKLATFVTFALTVSLHHRNPLVLQGGDAVVRMALFWGMFVPLGARFSIDEALDTQRPRPRPGFASVGTACLILQIAMLYWFTGSLKWHPVWHTEMSGVRFAMSLESFATWFGHQLLSFPNLMKVASVMTIVWELSGPVIALLPFWGGRLRLFGAVGFMAFHMLLLEPAMRLGYFTWAGATLWIAWIPAIFWDRLGARARTKERLGLRVYYDTDCGFCRKTARIVRSLFLLPETYVAPGSVDPKIQESIDREDSFVVDTHNGRRLYRVDALRELFGASPVVGWFVWPLLGVGLIARVADWKYRWIARNRRLLSGITARMRYRPSPLQPESSWVRKGIAVFLVVTLAYVFMWNLRTTDFKRWRKHFPRRLNVYANVLGIEQYWNLFAPYPIKDDGWYVVPGVFRNGQTRDLYWDRSPVDWLKPPLGTPFYANQRWSKYMMNIWKKKFKSQRLKYGRWLCRSINEDLPYSERLERLQIYFMRERTLDVGEERPKPVRIWRHYCTKKPEKWEEYTPEARAALARYYGPNGPDPRPAHKDEKKDKDKGKGKDKGKDKGDDGDARTEEPSDDPSDDNAGGNDPLKDRESE